MESSRAIEYLRERGITDEQLAAVHSHLDQAEAAADEVLTWALRARMTQNATEAVHAGQHLVAILRRHGDIPEPTMDAIQVMAVRCADLILQLRQLRDEAANGGGRS